MENSKVSQSHKDLLRFCTAGSVDDGKSTLVGRLLFETDSLFEDQILAAQQATQGEFPNNLDCSLVTDGLLAEREQKITIDVAYRYFETRQRKFILADAPGHVQYTRNLATAASGAEAGVLVVAANTGVTEQTRRHLFIMSLLGVKHIMVAINKMDLVDYSEAIYNQLRQEIGEFVSRLATSDLRFVPVSAKYGDNLVKKSEQTPWYQGETILSYLENVYVVGDENLIDVRLPIQRVIRHGDSFRGYCGTLASGRLHLGQKISVASSGLQSEITQIRTARSENAKEASAGEAITISLRDQMDVGRGEMLAPPMNQPTVSQDFEAMVVWFSDHPMKQTTSFLLKHTHRWTRGEAKDLRYKIDLSNTSRKKCDSLSSNDIGRVRIQTKDPLFVDSYETNRQTGCFLIVDEVTSQTLGLGLILKSQVAPHRRPAKFQAKAEPETVIWLTGLPGSGKSTIAKALQGRLIELGKPVVLLDGDSLRQGLNANLGFSQEDRSENVRRTAEVAKLFNQNGTTVIAALISPLETQRENARQIVGSSFIEVFVDCPVEKCIERDPKGHYQKAATGELKNYTGVSSEYQPPTSPTIHLKTGEASVQNCLESILNYLQK